MYHRKYRALLIAVGVVEWLAFGCTVVMAALINSDFLMSSNFAISAALSAFLIVATILMYIALPLAVPAALVTLTAQLRSMTPASEFALALSGEEIYRTLLREGRRSLLGWPLVITIPLILSVLVMHRSFLTAFDATNVVTGLSSTTLDALIVAPLLSMFVVLAAVFCAFEWQISMALRFPPRPKNRMMLVLPTVMGMLGMYSMFAFTASSYTLSMTRDMPWYDGSSINFPLLTLLGTLCGMGTGALLWKRAASSLKQSRWVLLSGLAALGLLLSSLNVQPDPPIAEIAAVPLAALRGILPGAISFGWGLPFLTADNPYDGSYVAATDAFSLADSGISLAPGLFANWGVGLLAVVLYFAFGYWVMRSANERVPEGYRGVTDD